MTLEDGQQIVLNNLQFAYRREQNTQARYLACAAQADQEGFRGAANLFRAAAAAEQVHARNHATVIRSMGHEPDSEVDEPIVSITRENLAASVQNEQQEHDAFYPRCISEAHGNVTALRTFRLAMQVEANHAQLFAQELKNLNGSGPQLYSVCTGCGYTTAKVKLTRCPACGEQKATS